MAIKKDADVNEVEEIEVQEEAVVEAEKVEQEPDMREQLAEKAEAARMQALKEQQEEDKNNEADAEDDMGADAQVDAAVEAEAKKVKVKLDGEELEVTTEELIRSYQKESVASRRLNEATAKLKEANEFLAKAKDGSAQKEEISSENSGDEATNIAKEAIESLLNGDEEAAAIALAKLAQGRGNSTQNDNSEDVVARVKQQLEVDSALTRFEDEYADVVSDPHLATITNGYLKEEMESGIHTSQYDALVAAGNRARGWITEVTGGKVQDSQSSTIRSDRVAKKAGMEKVPSNSASASSQEEPEETVADIIADMKKARGLLV